MSVRTTTLALLVTVGCATALAACSSPSKIGHAALDLPATHHARPAPASTTHTAVPAPVSGAPAAPVATSAGTVAPRPTPVDNELAGVLLHRSQLGAGFTRVANDPASPLPCTPHTAPADTQLAHVEDGGVSFVDSAGTTRVTEHIYVYPSPVSAIRHQQLDEVGLSCARGRAGDLPADVSGPTDVRTQLPGPLDKAEVWALGTSRATAELIMVRIHAVVVQFSFATTVNHPDVDAHAVLRAAVGKVLARRR